MHQRILTKIKNSSSEDWIVIETIVKHCKTRTLTVIISRKNSTVNGDNK